MKLLIFLSLAFFSLSEGNDVETEAFEKYKEGVKSALKKFVDIVEENDMNVTILMTKIDRWSNDAVKEVREHAIRFPANSVHKTESKITEEKIRDWVKTIKDISEIKKISGHGRIAHIKDGKTETIEKIPAPTDDAFETKMYKTETSVKSGIKHFDVDSPSFELYFNVHVPGADGKDENVEVVFGHVHTEVVKKSDTMSDDEVKELENKIREAFYKYGCRKVLGKVLKDHMNNKFENNDWQVIVDPGDEFYVPAKKYASVKAGNVEALVYAM